MPPRAARSAGGLAIVQVLLGLTLCGVCGAFAASWRQAGARYSSRDRARAVVAAYSQGVMEWQERHAGRGCPASLHEVRGLGLQRAPLRDPWGAPLVYRCPGTEAPVGFDLLSLGPDGREGTADDIRGWE